MADTTVIKVDSSTSPTGAEGEKFLAIGTSISMRLWENEEPGEKPESQRAYETVGYALQGVAELHIEGQSVILRAGDSWIVPKGARHHYTIVEKFSAVEATSPPAELYDRSQ